MNTKLTLTDVQQTHKADQLYFANAIYRLPTPPKVITPRALYPSKVKFLMKDGKEVV
jgi:hypothetical protein